MNDPNTQLGPYVEGMAFGLIDLQRIGNIEALGWKVSLEELDRHALVFTSPSGLRWRIVAQLLPETHEHN